MLGTKISITFTKLMMSLLRLGKGCDHIWDLKALDYPYQKGYGVVCTKCDFVLQDGLKKDVASRILRTERFKNRV